ncbi:MAG: arylesterase [Candidatus Omnitrophica bacterium]|nr:arylesterase [Candidatus Omnitrophota bacterium]
MISRSRFYRMSRAFIVAIGLVGVGSGCGSGTGDIANVDSQGESIICFGDSITEGVGAPANRGYPAVLASLLGSPIINAGRRGDTTYNAITRLEKEVLAKNPFLVIVEFGGNDMLKRIPSEETFRNLAQVIERIQEHGAMVLLVGVESDFPFSSSGYRRSYAELSRRYHTALIPNILEGILSNPDYKSDSIHPNEAGYRLIAGRIYDAVRPLLERNVALTQRGRTRRMSRAAGRAMR